MQKLKIPALLLATVLLLPSFFACNNKETQTSDSTTRPTTATTTTQKAEVTYENPDTQVIPSQDGKTRVIYALNIENAGKIEGETEQILASSRNTTKEVTVTPGVGYEFKGWSDGKTDTNRSGDAGEKGKTTTYYAILAPVALEMPILNITTETGQDVRSKTEYTKGTIALTNCDERYAFEEMDMEIRGRGNNSWSYEKKSYRIKFSEKINFMGVAKDANKSWNLIANMCDHTLLRNYTALKFAAMMPNIGFSPACVNVEVYLNGAYRGVYLMCEAIQIKDGRVDIHDNPEEGTDIGYLIQLTNYAESPKFDVGGRTYEIKNDLSTDTDLAWEQSLYIQDYVWQCYEAIVNGNREDIERLIDLPSVIDTYIVEETVKNLDVGWDSFYLYKGKGGKLYLGPIWDFDLSLGNADEGCQYYTDLHAAQNLMGQSNLWYYTLMSYDWFRDMVAERYQSAEVQKIIGSLHGMIQNEVDANYNSLKRNFDRWQIFGQRMNRETHDVVKLKNYDEHYNYLLNWLDNRIDWMNSFMGGDRYNEGYNTQEGGTSVLPPEFSGKGSGTAEDPYIVATAEDFASFTEVLLTGETYRNTYFLQTAHIDMTTVENYYGMGASANFAGIYNGGGYTIHAELWGNDECIFPYVSGVVMNLGTTGSVSNNQQAAGICRSIREGGAVINCYSLMDVSSDAGMAGGFSASTQSGELYLLNCYFAGTIRDGHGSPSNVWHEGRTGIFGYLYSPEDLGAENVSGDYDILLPRDQMNGALASTLNQNITDLAAQYSLDPALFCAWEAGENFPVLRQN